MFAEEFLLNPVVMGYDCLKIYQHEIRKREEYVNKRDGMGNRSKSQRRTYYERDVGTKPKINIPNGTQILHLQVLVKLIKD